MLPTTGGATKSELWLRLHADICNVNFILTAENEAPMLGSAICVSVGRVWGWKLGR